MPVIIRPPLTVAVEINRILNIPCVSTGVPTPNVTFFKDGNAVETDSRVTQSGQFLIITRIIASDTGEYHCLAENSVGNTTSEAVRIIVFSKFYTTPPKPA